MNRFTTVVSAISLLALLAAPSFADMTIRLKDGRSITLPIEPQDVESFDFGAGGAAPTTRGTFPSSPPLPSSPVMPASPGLRAATGSVAPIPGVSAPSLAPPVATPLATAAPSPMPNLGAQPKTSGRVLHVGSSRDYKTIHAAGAATKDGDTIEIDAGNYIGDTAIWKSDNLVIRGVNGRAHLDADGESAGGKGIWVTAGKNIRIENIEFSGAKVGDGNGAGIRAEGANLTLFNCYFHDNQEGILAADNPDSDIVIDSSAFVKNGTQSGQVHGIYINHIRTLFVRGSVFQGTSIGHHIKTRADTDYILYNRILDFADGTASYSVDMSNGGRGFIIGNVIEKGAKADNFTFIAMAMEGPSNSKQELYVVGNTMVLDRSSGVFIHSRSPGTIIAAGNIFSGPGAVLQGNGRLINNIIAGGSADNPDGNGGGGNKIVRDAGFVDTSKFDYHLKPGSPAIGAGVDPGVMAGFKLMPEYQNAYPLGVEPRPAMNPPDAGAYRFINAAR